MKKRRLIAGCMNEAEKVQPSFSDKVRGKPRAKTFGQEDLFGALDDNEGLIQVYTKDSWPAIKISPKLREALKAANEKEKAGTSNV